MKDRTGQVWQESRTTCSKGKLVYVVVRDAQDPVPHHDALVLSNTGWSEFEPGSLVSVTECCAWEVVDGMKRLA